MFMTFIFQMLTESNDNLEEWFREEEAKMRKDDNYIFSNERKLEIKNGIIKTLKILKIKIIIFVLLDSIMNLFSSYYMIAFCEVYKNTQINFFFFLIYKKLILLIYVKDNKLIGLLILYLLLFFLL